jgi:enamine deaminase RidA (YjgF/YER057c/UK114 family)
MTENNDQILVSNINDDQSYCTRDVDGVSGMTVTALSQFCGTEQQTITQFLNRLRDSDPITNELAECLKPFAGNDWRLITNDPSGSAFIIDEVCHAVLEYYALEARKYKGKQIAVNNYRMIAKAGLRVFIWSQTGYSPKSITSTGAISNTELTATITAAIEQALTPINQRLEQIEQSLKALPGAKPKRPWTLPASTPPEQVPEGYQQLDDGSWLSPEAYESILRQSRRSLPWDIRRFRDYE